MPDLDELFAQVDAQREDIIALEQALVKIPSVNTGFMPTGNETPVCEYIRDWLAQDGIQSEMRAVKYGKTLGNLIDKLHDMVTVYPLARLHDCQETRGDAPQISLNNTMLGTF